MQRHLALFLRFCMVGATGFVLDAGIVYALHTRLGDVPAQAVAFALATTWTWWWHRHYTFLATHQRKRGQWMRYVVSNVAGWICVNALYAWLVLRFAALHRQPVLALAMAAPMGIALNFAASHFFVFSRRVDLRHAFDPDYPEGARGVVEAP